MRVANSSDEHVLRPTRRPLGLGDCYRACRPAGRGVDRSLEILTAFGILAGLVAAML